MRLWGPGATPRPPPPHPPPPGETPAAPAPGAPAPPRRLRIGRDADRAGHVRRPAVPGLHEPVVVTGGKEEDGLAGRGLDDRGDVAHDQRSARQASEVDRLQMREQRVVALDREDRLPRLDAVALVERMDDEVAPAVLPAAVSRPPARALPEHRDRLVDAAEDRLLLLEHLHQDARVTPLLDEELLREVEVLIRVIAVADALHRQAEDGRLQALLHDAHAVIL